MQILKRCIIESFPDKTPLHSCYKKHKNKTMVAEKKVLFTEKYVEIFTEEDGKVLTAKWIGYLKLDDVQKGCGFLTDFIKKNPGVQHLSDHTQLKVLSKEVQDYLTGVWFGEVANIGLKKIAVLVSEDVFAQATVNKVNTKAQINDLKVNTYGTRSQCIDWLKE